MSGFILDCSIAICWCIDDESSPATDKLLHQARQMPVFVPAIWHMEIANVLMNAEKKKRLSATEVKNRFQELSSLPLHIDRETAGRAAWQESLALAYTEKLTVYDAIYLELAMRKDWPLATKDEDLIKAARRMKVETLPE